MKLVTISENAPIIRRVQYSPAAIYIQFPDGNTWEYIIYDDLSLRQLLRRYKYNVGRLVAELKRLGVEAQKI